MSWMRDLPREAADAIVAETRGEIVSWAGRPKPSGAFWRTPPIWLMGIPWSALTFGIFGALLAAALSVPFGPPPSREIAPWEFVAMAVALVFTGAFVVVGLGMLGAPFWVWWKSRRMVYALTDRRLVRIGYGRKRDVASFNPAQFVSIHRREKPDGTGTLTITTRLSKDSDGDTVKETEMLVGIPDAATADRLLRAMMAG